MLVCHVEQHKAMLRQEPQQEARGCQRYGTGKSFCAAEGGQGREHGIRCVPWERQIADAAFAAGSAYLVFLVLYVGASSRQTVLQWHTALGDGYAFPGNFHHVLAEAVPRTSWTIDIRSPAVAFVIICCLFAGEAFKSVRKWRGGGVEVDDVLHREVPGLCSPQPAGHEAEQQDAGQPGLRGHRPPRPCSCGGPGSAAAGRKLTFAPCVFSPTGQGAPIAPSAEWGPRGHPPGALRRPVPGSPQWELWLCAPQVPRLRPAAARLLRHGANVPSARLAAALLLLLSSEGPMPALRRVNGE